MKCALIILMLYKLIPRTLAILQLNETDHAVIKGETLTIGGKGNGTCKYSGTWSKIPTWIMENKTSAYLISAGANLFEKYGDVTPDIRLKKTREPGDINVFSLVIETKNTSLAGRYKCEHSDEPEEVIHNVVVMDDLKCKQNQVVFLVGEDQLNVNCTIPIWGAPNHALPTLELYSSQSSEDILSNYTWNDRGEWRTLLEEDVLTNRIEDREYVTGENELTLQILRNVTIHDHGKSFTCNMTDMRGWNVEAPLPECLKMTEIIVHHAPEFTIALETSQSKHFQDDRLNLTCGVVGNPRPTIKWLINNISDDRIRPKELLAPREIISVVLFRVREGDNIISCVASNNLSTIVVTTPLVILPPAVITNVTFDPNPVREGDELFINCSAFPPAHMDFYYEWTEGDEKIENSTLIADKSMNNRSVRCLASLVSRFGEARNTSMITANAINVTYGAYISCEDVEAAESGDHVLVCDLEANPPFAEKDIAWRDEEGRFLDNEKFYINTTVDGLKVISKLTIYREYIYKKQRLDFIFGLTDNSKTRQIVVDFQDVNISTASAGLTAGIVIGAVVILLLIIVLIFGIKSAAARNGQGVCNDINVIESANPKKPLPNEPALKEETPEYLVRGVRSEGARRTSVAQSTGVKKEIRKTSVAESVGAKSAERLSVAESVSIMSAASRRTTDFTRPKSGVEIIATSRPTSAISNVVKPEPHPQETMSKGPSSRPASRAQSPPESARAQRDERLQSSRARSREAPSTGESPKPIDRIRPPSLTESDKEFEDEPEEFEDEPEETSRAESANSNVENLVRTATPSSGLIPVKSGPRRTSLADSISRASATVEPIGRVEVAKA